ncbi:MAG: hypothetical protein AAF950_06815 [Pseudomonadota bacterium]
MTGGLSARDGLGSDTRVFLDNHCVRSESGTRTFGPGLSTLGEIAVGTGQVIFQSFGRYLEERGQPDIDTSSGVASDFFYKSVEADTGLGALNDSIQCVHIVRGGFEPSSRGKKNNEHYGHLNLTSEPSLYALVKLEPAQDKSAFFRGKLEHFIVNRFERAGGELTRDIVIALEFGSPAAARLFVPDDFGNPTPNAGGAFAVSSLQLPGVERGRAFNELETNGLYTAWMNTPPGGDQSGQYAFNLYVDIVETKQGNPFLQDIGRVLQSEPVVTAVTQDISDAIYDDTDRRRERIGSEFDLRLDEQRLRRALQDEVRFLESLIDSNVTDEDTLIGASRRVEDAIEGIRRHKRLDGWNTHSIDPLVRRAEAAIRRVELIISGLLNSPN